MNYGPFYDKDLTDMFHLFQCFFFCPDLGPKFGPSPNQKFPNLEPKITNGLR
jgi:hypothetical protein